MVDDLEILARIEKLLQAGRQEIYGGPNDPRTPLVHYKPHTGFNHIPHPLIMIPEGSAAGVSVDPAGNILGIKLASVGRYTDEIFALICDLQHLEYLVFFPHVAFDIPEKIRNLTRLKVALLEKISGYANRS